MMWGYYAPDAGWMGWSMALSALFWLALLGVIIWAVVRLTTRRDQTPVQAPPPSAEEILRQRYARGEIDAQTFETMRERLQATSSAEELSAPHI